jgi:hypothetical protein
MMSKSIVSLAPGATACAVLAVAVLVSVPARAEILLVDKPMESRAYNIGKRVTAGGVQVWIKNFNPVPQSMVDKQNFIELWTRDVEVCYEEYSDYITWRAGKNYVPGLKLKASVEGVNSIGGSLEPVRLQGTQWDPAKTYKFKTVWNGKMVQWVLDGRVVLSGSMPNDFDIQLINLGSTVRFQGFPGLKGPVYEKIVVWEGEEPADLDTVDAVKMPEGINPHMAVPLMKLNPNADVVCTTDIPPKPAGGIPDPPSAGAAPPKQGGQDAGAAPADGGQAPEGGGTTTEPDARPMAAAPVISPPPVPPPSMGSGSPAGTTTAGADAGGPGGQDGEQPPGARGGRSSQGCEVGGPATSSASLLVLLSLAAFLGRTLRRRRSSP